MLKKRLSLFISVLILSVVLVACGNSENSDQTTDPETPTEDASNESTNQEPLEITITDEEKVEDSKVVLIVNDEEVTGEMYNDAYFNTKRYMMQNNQDTSDIELVKKQTLTTLKSFTLLKQDAKEKEITVTEKDVNQAVEATKEQFESESAYQYALTQLAYTEESFKQSLSEQLLQQAYIDEVIETEDVTDEEIAEFYDILKEQLDDAPALEEVREQIVMQIEQSKVQDAFLKQMEALNEQATIEENL